MNQKMTDMYKQSEQLVSLSAEVSNLAKTISDSMNYGLGKSKPFYHLVSVAELLDEKAELLSDSCDELSCKILLELQAF